MDSSLTDGETVLAEAPAEHSQSVSQANGTLEATQKRIRFSGGVTIDIATDKIVETGFFRETWSPLQITLAFSGAGVGLLSLLVALGVSGKWAGLLRVVGVVVLCTTAIVSYLVHQSHRVQLQIVTVNSSHTFESADKEELGKVYHLIWRRLLHD